MLAALLVVLSLNKLVRGKLRHDKGCKINNILSSMHYKVL